MRWILFILSFNLFINAKGQEIVNPPRSHSLIREPITLDSSFFRRFKVESHNEVERIKIDESKIVFHERPNAINMSRSGVHSPIRDVTYIVDNMEIDSLLFRCIKFEGSDMQKVRTEGSKIIFNSRLLIVLDDKTLYKKKKEKKLLANIKKV